MYIFLAPSYYSIIEVFIYCYTASNQYDSTTMNQQICTSAVFHGDRCLSHSCYFDKELGLIFRKKPSSILSFVCVHKDTARYVLSYSKPFGLLPKHRASE